MSRISAKAITIRSHVRCDRICPTEDTRRTIGDLKTVGLKLNKDQAIDLARVLLAVTQEWDEIEITAYRFEKQRADGTYLVTVTSRVGADKEDSK
jgi:hypothetical protein